MSQIDEGAVSGAQDEQDEIDNVKLVPVSESIRYRKRAQGAEKLVEELTGELAGAKAEAGRLADELKAAQKEQELMRRLASEGARDLEAAILIAKTRLAKDEKGDLNIVVEQLKKEKSYLFLRQGSGQVGEKAAESVADRTSPAKEQRSGAGALDRSAKRAAGTGSRSDLQEYMRKRRSVF